MVRPPYHCTGGTSLRQTHKKDHLLNSLVLRIHYSERKSKKRKEGSKYGQIVRNTTLWLHQDTFFSLKAKRNSPAASCVDHSIGQ